MGVSVSKKLFEDDIEQFLSMIQFKHRGKLEDLPIYK